MKIRTLTTTLDFDELNELDADKQAYKAEIRANKTKVGYVPIPYREFFGKMHIEPEQMDERIALAEDIEREVLFIFAYWAIRADLDPSAEQLKAELKERLYGVIESRTRADDYIKSHINELVDQIIDTTEKRDNERRKHNLLVPYEKLAQSEKEKDGIYDPTIQEEINKLI